MSNILIIKHGSLGDIAQACGAIQDISENHNNDKIYLLTTKRYFDLFKKNRDKLNFPKGQKILVEKRTSSENKGVLYPFIQFEDSDIGYYQFDMGIYELEDIYK